MGDPVWRRDDLPDTRRHRPTVEVFDPNSFRAFASPLGSAVVVDPKSGKQKFRQWQFFGLGQTLVGSAVTVDVGGLLTSIFRAAGAGG